MMNVYIFTEKELDINSSDINVSSEALHVDDNLNRLDTTAAYDDVLKSVAKIVSNLVKCLIKVYIITRYI